MDVNMGGGSADLFLAFSGGGNQCCFLVPISLFLPLSIVCYLKELRHSLAGLQRCGSTAWTPDPARMGDLDLADR